MKGKEGIKSDGRLREAEQRFTTLGTTVVGLATSELRPQQSRRSIAAQLLSGWACSSYRGGGGRGGGGGLKSYALCFCLSQSAVL
eukprot:5863664-Amphidinium_carterae.2